jgi:SOS-response transcriptional repressor LexA
VRYGVAVPVRLTEQQAALLGILRDHIKQTGYPPTVREIIKLGPWTSTSSVAHQLRALENKGWIRRVVGQARTIQIVDTDTEDQVMDADTRRRWIVGAVAAYLRQEGWEPEPGREATEDDRWARAELFIDAVTDPAGVPS